jgi:hypothetical protein
VLLFEDQRVRITYNIEIVALRDQTLQLVNGVFLLKLWEFLKQDPEDLLEINPLLLQEVKAGVLFQAKLMHVSLMFGLDGPPTRLDQKSTSLQESFASKVGCKSSHCLRE